MEIKKFQAEVTKIVADANDATKSGEAGLETGKKAQVNMLHGLADAGAKYAPTEDQAKAICDKAYTPIYKAPESRRIKVAAAVNVVLAGQRFKDAAPIVSKFQGTDKAGGRREFALLSSAASWLRKNPEEKITKTGYERTLAELATGATKKKQTAKAGKARLVKVLGELEELGFGGIETITRAITDHLTAPASEGDTKPAPKGATNGKAKTSEPAGTGVPNLEDLMAMMNAQNTAIQAMVAGAAKK